MEIAVTDAHGLPEKAFLSIRVGDQRRQMQYKAGEPILFEPQKPPRHFTVDVFEKVGTKQVSLADLAGPSGQLQAEVPRSNSGKVMNLNFKVDYTTCSSSKRLDDRQQATVKAKGYLDGHAVQKVLQGMVHSLLKEQPQSPIDFMMKFLEAQRSTCQAEVSPISAPPPPTSPTGRMLARSGRGRFEADGSVPLPSLAGHHSVMAEQLRKNPSLYDSLKDVRTPLGVPLAACIKTGVDNKGHKMIKMVGLVAGDEHCYEVFKDLFEPVISCWHDNYAPEAFQTCDLDPLKVSGNLIAAAPVERGSTNAAVSCYVRGSRNLSGLRMPPTASEDERLRVESIVSGGLLGMQGKLKGDYHPLRGSSSFPSKPRGMTSEVEAELREHRLLFEEPDSSVLLSSGVGRQWPEGRGVFASDSQEFAVWVNEVEHIHILCPRSDGDLKKAFETFVNVENALGECAEAAGNVYARSDHLGFLTAEPSRLGTSLDIGVVLSLPSLRQEQSFKTICRDLGVNVRMSADELSTGDQGADLWLVSNKIRLGSSEVSQVTSVLEACCTLVKLESDLKVGKALELATKVEEAPGPGFGDEECPGFPADSCPPDLPSLDGKHSLAAGVLRRDPSIYGCLRERRTPLGVAFGKCIKTAMDNNGHPMIKTIGAVAGDEACYETFREFFDPIISLRHPGYDAIEGHATDMDPQKVVDVALDPTGRGDRVAYVRLRLGRNIGGFRLPPSCSFAERREVERVALQALEQLNGQLAGTYWPLVGSNSYAPRPGGMDENEEDALDAEGLLFEAPDSEVKLSSGYGRSWPDARGVFAGSIVSGAPTFAAFVNDEDHMHLISSQSGGNLKDAFAHICSAHQAIAASLEAGGQSFVWSERLGYISSCPSNLGTGLAATAALRLPLLSSQRQFRALCRQLGLQACIGAAGDSAEGIWEVSNAQRLGSSEADQVNAVINGCRQLLDYEARLEQGEQVPLDSLVLSPCASAALFSSTPVSTKAQRCFPGAALSEPSPRTVSRAVSAVSEVDVSMFKDVPGLGADDVPGFPADACPDELPDLSKHHSFVTQVLREDPSLYERLKGLKTTHGATLARCIKSGIDNKGHPMVKTIGACASDLECYDLFSELFDALVCKRFPNFSLEAGHSSDLDHSKVSDEPLDPTGNSVLCVNIRTGRNLAGIPFPSAASSSERREAEVLLTEALSGLPREFQGKYLPLRGSSSYVARPGGMSLEEEAELEQDGVAFQEPDTPLRLSMGVGRDWPHGRGVFYTEIRELAAWINEDDHLRLISGGPGADLKGAFARLCTTSELLDKALSASAHGFARSAKLGYLTVDLGNLGTGLQIEVAVRLPLLGRSKGDLKEMCRNLGLQARPATDMDEEGVYDICSLERSRLGSSEVEQVNGVADGVRKLLEAEMKLRPAQPLQREDSVPGLGDEDVPGFPTETCPEELPDLSAHHSMMADVLRKDSALYGKLRGLRTSTGVCLARCLKPGMDSMGHPMLRTVGLVAGDAECYEVFADLFTPVISARHAGFRGDNPDARHPTILDVAQMDPAPLDPSGRFIVSARICTARNLQGIRFPPAISSKDRLKVENILTEALLQLEEAPQGQYFPLQGSSSFAPRPEGMTKEEQKELDAQGLLFQEPEAALLLSAGIGRQWPQGRGVFRSRSKQVAAWLNEENHLRLTITEPGDGLREAFGKLCRVQDALQETLKKAGHEFAWSEQLGFLTTCPSDLGSGGLRLNVLAKLPLLSAQDDFKKLCKGLNLIARPSSSEDNGDLWNGDLWNIAVSGRLGLSEAELANQLAAGCRALIDKELELETRGF